MLVPRRARLITVPRRAIARVGGIPRRARHIPRIPRWARLLVSRRARHAPVAPRVTGQPHHSHLARRLSRGPQIVRAPAHMVLRWAPQILLRGPPSQIMRRAHRVVRPPPPRGILARGVLRGGLRRDEVDETDLVGLVLALELLRRPPYEPHLLRVSVSTRKHDQLQGFVKHTPRVRIRL